MTDVEFADWESQQPLRFELADGRPARLPDADQGPSRVARVLQIAGRVLADQDAADAWMRSPQAALGGLEPEALAADSEEGCQIVVRALVARAGTRRPLVADILSGARVGPFIVFKDADGKRHAVRHGAILSVSEGEDDVVSIAMFGNRTALVRQAFDRVLSWFR